MNNLEWQNNKEETHEQWFNNQISLILKSLLESEWFKQVQQKPTILSDLLSKEL